MPQTLTPLRYPGGKSQLYDYTLQLLEDNNLIGCTYSEPFAGGCGLALKLLLNGRVSRVILNDIDRSIYAFWWSVLNDNDNLIDLVNTTPVTIEEWNKQRLIQANKESAELLELGFSTFFLNRTNFSGIINAGPIGGELQDGKYKLNCRYNKSSLISKLKKIHTYRREIELFNKDAIDFFSELDKITDDSLFIFLDPPYFNKGPGLYTNFYTNEDHKKLAENVVKLKHKWVVTYDNVNEIKQIYDDLGAKYIEYSLRYSARSNTKSTEVMFFSENINPASF